MNRRKSVHSSQCASSASFFPTSGPQRRRHAPHTRGCLCPGSVGGPEMHLAVFKIVTITLSISCVPECLFSSVRFCLILFNFASVIAHLSHLYCHFYCAERTMNIRVCAVATAWPASPPLAPITASRPILCAQSRSENERAGRKSLAEAKKIFYRKSYLMLLSGTDMCAKSGSINISDQPFWMRTIILLFRKGESTGNLRRLGPDAAATMLTHKRGCFAALRKPRHPALRRPAILSPCFRTGLPEPPGWRPVRERGYRRG